MTRSSKSAVNDRTPLHASAMRLNDVRPGVHYVRFNMDLGIQESGTFASEPYVATWGPLSKTRLLVVRVLRNNGHLDELALVDMGIVPYSGNHWNRVNFAIRPNKRHLLPEPTGSSRSFMDDYEPSDIDPYQGDDDVIDPWDDPWGDELY